MSVTHSTTTRNSFCTTVASAIDSGGPGKLVFRLSGTIGSPGTAVATLTLSASSFGAASAGAMTAAAITSDTSATGNASAVANASLQTAAGTLIVHCAVAASASDINMSGGLTVGAGDTVSCSSLTYTAAP